MTVADLSNAELLSNVTSLLGSQRELTANLVAHLAEIEQRRLHLELGYSSMFEFCVKRLRMSEGEAYRRILAARLVRRFPVIHPLIASGRVHLSALQLLGDRLTDENHAELLEAVRHKSKREVEELLAARFPKPDVKSNIRKLPDPPTAAASNASGGQTAELALQPDPSPARPPPNRPRIEPLSEGRFKVQLTASATLRDKLERARDLMSHANPSRDLAVVVERALDLLLVELEKKKLGKTKRPRVSRASRQTKPGHVKSADRRKVFESDGLQCSYVGPDGHRCEATAFLELDHTVPKGLGGGDDADNIRVRCHAHNQLWAEQAYGREHIESCRRFRKKKRRAPAVEAVPTSQDPKIDSGDVYEKVRNALEGMGFRNAEARRAVSEVARNHSGKSEQPGVEQVLREALLIVDCGPRHRTIAAKPSIRVPATFASESDEGIDERASGDHDVRNPPLLRARAAFDVPAPRRA